MMKLISTKKKIENNDFKVTIGATNKKRPITFYLELNGTASPINKGIVTSDLTKMLSLAIKKISASIVKEYSFEKCSISDIDFSEESLKNGKDAYLTIQFYFMQLLTNDFNELCRICECIIDKYVKVIKKNLLEYNIEIRKTR